MSCLSDDTVLSFVLPYRMNGPGEEKRNLRLLTQVSKRLLSNRRRAGDSGSRGRLRTYSDFRRRINSPVSLPIPLLWNKK